MISSPDNRYGGSGGGPKTIDLSALVSSPVPVKLIAIPLPATSPDSTSVETTVPQPRPAQSAPTS